MWFCITKGRHRISLGLLVTSQPACAHLSALCCFWYYTCIPIASFWKCWLSIFYNQHQISGLCEVCWWRHSPLAFNSQRCVITYFWYYTHCQLLKMLVIVATHHLATVFSRASYKKFYYWLRLSELTNKIDPSITVDALLLILSFQSCVKYNKSLYR